MKGSSANANVPSLSVKSSPVTGQRHRESPSGDSLAPGPGATSNSSFGRAASSGESGINTGPAAAVLLQASKKDPMIRQNLIDQVELFLFATEVRLP